RNTAFVVSSDMLAYGGLIASRAPGATYADARSRLLQLRATRAARPDAFVAAFGTVMRLAPTGAPAWSGFFAAYPVWTYLQAYANLHDPPLPDEMQTAQHLQTEIPPATLAAYLQTRARDVAVDRFLLELVSEGAIDRLVLGQDDAGLVGLHVKDVQLLESTVRDENLAQRVSIEPGADELGMALVANALARHARWTPHIGVRFSTPTGAMYRDPLEYAPISSAIDALVGLCGGVRDDARPDIVLSVRVPGTDATHDDAFVAAIDADAAAGREVALADLSFLQSYASQKAFAERILSSGLARRLDAYAAWNTNANTVGTALAEAVAAGAGRRAGIYDALAHRTFTFVRFLDDYVFHDEVRIGLNAQLEADNVADRSLLPPDLTATLSAQNRAILWNRAEQLVAQLDPGYHIAAITIDLPWNRTFETKIDAALAPNL
ncbi:MAG: DUF4127 family protein, partial [Candidatus Eremiobacteraeota bacterium]|nr:DUF4127 family protein [Candidatus Eremiobacteraeota bacterium]